MEFLFASCIYTFRNWYITNKCIKILIILLREIQWYHKITLIFTLHLESVANKVYIVSNYAVCFHLLHSLLKYLVVAER